MTDEWHMRRVLLTAERFFPRRMLFVCCPTTEWCNRDVWTHREECRRAVTGEAGLLQRFLANGMLGPWTVR